MKVMLTGNEAIARGAYEYGVKVAMGYPGPPMAFICLDQIMRHEPLAKGDLVLSFVTEVSKFMQAGYILEYK